MDEFSVLMSVYKKEKAEYFAQAIDSVINQSVMPKEIIVIKDGLLTKELEEKCNFYRGEFGDLFRFIQLEQNQGLGNALKIGVLECHCDIIARMDTDDISCPNRFEKQLAIFKRDPQISVVGSFIAEFDADIFSFSRIRKVPISHKDITLYAKMRNPFNHMTVMFKKRDVVDSGNYQDFLWHEDYFLWARMIKKGYKMMNLDECLVYARTGNEIFARRGGIKYAWQECQLQYAFLSMDFISFFEAIRNVAIRFFVRIVPNKIRKYIYLKFLRR